MVLAVAAIVLPIAGRAQTTTRLNGIFGDLHYVPEAGDVIGTEIIVSRTKSGYRVIFQEGYGEPGPVDTVPATIKGDSLFFELPPDRVYGPQPRLFHGQILPNKLHGRLTGIADDLDLPRRAHSARAH